MSDHSIFSVDFLSSANGELINNLSKLISLQLGGNNLAVLISVLLKVTMINRAAEYIHNQRTCY